MNIDRDDYRALNTAVSGLSVSLSHVNRLNNNGVVEADSMIESLTQIIDALKERRRALETE